jgi:hypothetical protein
MPKARPPVDSAKDRGSGGRRRTSGLTAPAAAAAQVATPVLAADPSLVDRWTVAPTCAGQVPGGGSGVAG